LVRLGARVTVVGAGAEHRRQPLQSPDVGHIAVHVVQHGRWHAMQELVWEPRR
jgi:hypothetical protein